MSLSTTPSLNIETNKNKLLTPTWTKVSSPPPPHGKSNISGGYGKRMEVRRRCHIYVYYCNISIL